ncbi:voltage-dependent anion channel, partial [Microdochium trichocladiopsis]
MGTGIVSILLFTFSETYPDSQALLFQLSVFFFGLNIFLYSVILSATVLRYVFYPKFFVMMISDPGQAMYLGTMPMGLATLITMTVNVIVPRFDTATSTGWATTAWAIWWIDVVISLACALGVPWLVQTRHRGITDLEKMTAGWLLPIVSPIVASSTGSAVASVLSPPDALVTILVSYVILGTGLCAALTIIVIYYLRITTWKLPPTEHMFSTFLPLGALGQGGFAFQQLGAQAIRVFPVTETLPAMRAAAGGVTGGPEAVADALLVAKILFTLGFVIAIMLWGFAMLWLFFAVLSVTRQRVPFSNGWWASTFPLGVLATSTLAMGRNLPSVAFQTLGTIFGVVVIFMWVVVSSMLVARVATGKKWT